MIEMLPVAKAVAYVVNEGRLLIFRQPDFPEAGLQVPAGTVEEGEAPADAALREAVEETGLDQLELVGFLGRDLRPMLDVEKNEVHDRSFFLIDCHSQVPVRWLHSENHASTGDRDPILFNLFWVDLAKVPKLAVDQDRYIPACLDWRGRPAT